MLVSTLGQLDFQTHNGSLSKRRLCIFQNCCLYYAPKENKQFLLTFQFSNSLRSEQELLVCFEVLLYFLKTLLQVIAAP